MGGDLGAPGAHERERLRRILRRMREIPAALTEGIDGVRVVLTDHRGRALTLTTDRRRQTPRIADGEIVVRAHREARTLVVEEDFGSR